MTSPDQPQKKVSVVKGFGHFVSQYGVVPLAIGVVIGNSVNDVVKSLVENIITPFIGLVSPEGKLQSLQWTFHGSVFKVGAALNAFLSFLIVAWIVYVVAKFILRNDELLKKK